MNAQISNPEQSRRLVELGISLDKASMIYVNDADTPTFREEITVSLDEIVQDGHHFIPAFTIADVDNILPAVIVKDKIQYLLTIEVLPCSQGKIWRYSYKNSGTKELSLVSTQNKNRIEAALSLVTNLSNNSYCCMADM